MVDWLAPTAGHFAKEHRCQHQDPQEQDNPTYMVMLPNHMPAHSSDQIAGHVAWMSHDMALQGKEIISDQVVNAG